MHQETRIKFLWCDKKHNLGLKMNFVRLEQEIGFPKFGPLMMMKIEGRKLLTTIIDSWGKIDDLIDFES